MEGLEVVMVPDINVCDTLVRDVVNEFRALVKATLDWESSFFGVVQ